MESPPIDDQSISYDASRKESLASIENFLREPVRTFESRATTAGILSDRSSGLLSDISPVKAKSIQERFLESRIGVILAGQGVSLVVSTVAAAQGTLYFKCGLSAPAFSLSFIYFFLWIGLWTPLWMEGRKTRLLMHETNARDVQERHWFLGMIPTHLSGWKYAGIALISVEANYFVAKALRYTTITSATVFDAVALPSAMSLSIMFLKRQYRIVHFVGALICVSGIVLNLVVDFVADEQTSVDAATVQVKDEKDAIAFDDGSEEYPDKTIGDVLALVGAILYGASDVLTEHCVRHYGGVAEFLGMVGFWGFWICLIQSSILERGAIADFFQPSDSGDCSLETAIVLLVVYVCCQLIRKLALATFLTVSEAALLNMSLLTSDLYSAAFSIVAQHILPRSLFWVSTGLIVSGIVVYESGGSPLGGDKHTPSSFGDQLRTQDDPSLRNIAPASNTADEANLRFRTQGSAVVTRI